MKIESGRYMGGVVKVNSLVASCIGQRPTERGVFLLLHGRQNMPFYDIFVTKV